MENQGEFWNDDKVIDFVNWNIRRLRLPFRYELENQYIIDSFKRGDDYKVWWIHSDGREEIPDSQLFMEELYNLMGQRCIAVGLPAHQIYDLLTQCVEELVVKLNLNTLLKENEGKKSRNGRDT